MRKLHSGRERASTSPAVLIGVCIPSAIAQEQDGCWRHFDELNGALNVFEWSAICRLAA
jgi:hypothetical protein